MIFQDLCIIRQGVFILYGFTAMNYPPTVLPANELYKDFDIMRPLRNPAKSVYLELTGNFSSKYQV